MKKPLMGIEMAPALFLRDQLDRELDERRMGERT
jgi:hypothetical protein